MILSIQEQEWPGVVSRIGQAIDLDESARTHGVLGWELGRHGRCQVLQRTEQEIRMSTAEIADNKWEVQASKPPVATAGGRHVEACRRCAEECRRMAGAVIA